MAVGTEFIIDQLKYIVLTESGTTGTVSVGAKDVNITGDIVIPETVSNNGITYTVTLLLNEGTTGLLVNCVNVTSLYISKTIIGTTNGYTYNLFMGANGLRSINVDPDNQYFSSDDGVLYNKNKTNLIGYPRNKLDSVFNMPDTVEKISNSSIRYMINSPKYINLSKNINNIEASNFRDCLKLIKINIPYISNIGNSVIQGNNNLKELSYDAYSLNNNMTGLNNLRTLTIGSHVNSASLTQSPFLSCPNIQTVNVDSQYVVDHFKDFFPQITSSDSPLRYVNIGDSVTSIGDNAFLSGNSLREVNIGKNVESIGGMSFDWCRNLKYFNISDQNKTNFKLLSSQSFAYANCYKLSTPENFYFNSPYGTNGTSFLSFGNNILELNGTYTFLANAALQWFRGRKIKFNDKLKSITARSLDAITYVRTFRFPDTVNELQNQCFGRYSNTTLGTRSIVFEGNCPTTLHDQAFSGSNLSVHKVYYYQDTIGWENWSTTYPSVSIQKVFRGEVTVGNYTYKFVDGINGTPNVSVRAANNVKLSGVLDVPQTVTIDDVIYTVRYVADNGFENQYNITSFDMHNQYLEIGKDAFTGCRNLTTVSNTNGITDIGEGAFNGCSNLTSFVIPTIELYSTSGHVNVYHPIPKNCFKDCKKLQSITLSDYTYEIQESAFENCTSLQSINISNECNKIYQNAFRNCTSLQSVTYGNNLYIIYDNAFQNCQNLRTFTIASGSTNDLETLKDNVFANCYRLESAPLGAIRDIGKYCFYYNQALTSITLPATTDYVDDCAFANCNHLTTLTNNTPNNAEFGTDVFYGTGITF